MKNLFTKTLLIGGIAGSLGIFGDVRGQDTISYASKEPGNYFRVEQGRSPMKISAMDNNQDSIIDEYNIFLEDTNKIIEVKCKDENFDGKFESSERAVYYKKEHRLDIDPSYKDLSFMFKEYKKGNYYTNCDKDYFKKNLFCYLKGQKTQGLEEDLKNSPLAIYIDLNALCDED